MLIIIGFNYCFVGLGIIESHRENSSIKKKHYNTIHFNVISILWREKKISKDESNDVFYFIFHSAANKSIGCMIFRFGLIATHCVFFLIHCSCGMRIRINQHEF